MLRTVLGSVALGIATQAVSRPERHYGTPASVESSTSCLAELQSPGPVIQEPILTPVDQNWSEDGLTGLRGMGLLDARRGFRDVLRCQSRDRTQTY